LPALMPDPSDGYFPQCFNETFSLTNVNIYLAMMFTLHRKDTRICTFI